MNCSDKFRRLVHAPGGETRVDPEEVDGRPICDHPGCGKKLLGTGECVDGHVQGAALPPAARVPVALEAMLCVADELVDEGYLSPTALEPLLAQGRAVLTAASGAEQNTPEMQEVRQALQDPRYQELTSGANQVALFRNSKGILRLMVQRGSRVGAAGWTDNRWNEHWETYHSDEQASQAFPDFSDRQALRTRENCPHCGQFLSAAGAHVCPQTAGDTALRALLGQVRENALKKHGGELLELLDDPRWQAVQTWLADTVEAISDDQIAQRGTELGFVGAHELQGSGDPDEDEMGMVRDEMLGGLSLDEAIYEVARARERREGDEDDAAAEDTTALPQIAYQAVAEASPEWREQYFRARGTEQRRVGTVGLLTAQYNVLVAAVRAAAEFLDANPDVEEEAEGYFRVLRRAASIVGPGPLGPVQLSGPADREPLTTISAGKYETLLGAVSSAAEYLNYNPDLEDDLPAYTATIRRAAKLTYGSSPARCVDIAAWLEQPGTETDIPAFYGTNARLIRGTALDLLGAEDVQGERVLVTFLPHAGDTCRHFRTQALGMVNDLHAAWLADDSAERETMSTLYPLPLSQTALQAALGEMQLETAPPTNLAWVKSSRFYLAHGATLDAVVEDVFQGDFHLHTFLPKEGDADQEATAFAEAARQAAARALATREEEEEE